jgi:hypothetical protein
MQHEDSLLAGAFDRHTRPTARPGPGGIGSRCLSLQTGIEASAAQRTSVHSLAPVAVPLMPGKKTPIRLIGKQWFPKQRRYQLVEKEQQLRSKIPFPPSRAHHQAIFSIRRFSQFECKILKFPMHDKPLKFHNLISRI